LSQFLVDPDFEAIQAALVGSGSNDGQHISFRHLASVGWGVDAYPKTLRRLGARRQEQPGHRTDHHQPYEPQDQHASTSQCHPQGGGPLLGRR
jgi:hypothetical protein